jgi:sugar lactone lactonase YvrE
VPPLQTLSWQKLPNSQSQLGESPFWHPLESMLYWVDIPGQQICRANVFMGEVERWQLTEDPGCIAPAKGGGLVVALRSGAYLARHWGQAMTLLAPAPYDTATQRFNDGKCDAQGRLWAATLYEPKTHAQAALYCLHKGPAGYQWQAHIHQAVTGNGLAWSPNGQTLYWVDTPSHAIKTWSFQDLQTRVSPTSWADAPAWHQFAEKPPGWGFVPHSLDPHNNAAYAGRPDGAAMDQNGNYWVAMFEGQRLCVLSPTGQLIAQYATPALRSTMVCFGGDDGQTLYLTTARKGQSAVEQKAQPDAGHVYHARVGTPGVGVGFFDEGGH